MLIEPPDSQPGAQGQAAPRAERSCAALRVAAQPSRAGGAREPKPLTRVGPSPNGGYGIGIEHATATTTAAKPLNATHDATHTDSGTVLSSGLPARWSPLGAEYVPPAAPPGRAGAILSNPR